MPDLDVVIIGGGVMGSATAYHLIRSEPSLNVTVVERDPSYDLASTVRSDGNVRIQFNLEENIRISQHTLAVLRTFDADMATDTFTPAVAPRYQGNLFLAAEGDVKAAKAGLELQRSLGCRVEWLDTHEISRLGDAYTTRGVVGGTLGHDDGSVDPTALLHGYRAKAVELGVSYVEGSVADLVREGDRLSGVTTTEGESIGASWVVVTAGAWSVPLLERIGVEIPVRPYVRTEYVVTTPFESAGLPSIFLPNGVHVLSESENMWVIGWSLADDPISYEITPASRARFEQKIWPALVGYLR